jgi:hypothetical protein
MLLYYRIMTKWSGLGDSTKLSRVGLSQRVATRHLARVRGVGLLQRAEPSDVPAVPLRCGLLVRLLQRLQCRELEPRT